MFTGLTMTGWVLAIMIGAGGDEKGVSSTTRPRGRILDVFENNQVLISIGKDQGVKKGLVMHVFELNSAPLRLLGAVELVEIGTDHSIGSLKDIAYNPYAMYSNNPYALLAPLGLTTAFPLHGRRAEVNDHVFLPEREFDLSAAERMRLEKLRIEREEWNRILDPYRVRGGGDLIDRTSPKHTK
jgi:hypothetical protein